MLNTNKTILTIAFICGMSVTAMEISASRLIAPYFGTSLFVWTNIIGIVLVSLSLGYYCGGKLSEKHPSLPFLLKAIFIAGILFFITPLIVGPLAASLVPISMFAGNILHIILGSLFVSLILFGAPLALVGMTSPFLIKIRTLNSTDTGNAAGSIFAFSTVGSIVGTFAPTLFFIPNFGTRATMAIFAATLIVMGSFGFVGKIKRIAIILLLLPISFTFAAPLKPNQRLIDERESVHQFIQVLQLEDKTTYLITNEGSGVQSIYHPDKRTTGAYYDAFMLLPYLSEKQEPIDVLIVGLAGGTIARGMHEEFGKAISLEGVEIDPVMTEIAKKHFGLDKVPITVHHTDGRIFLQNTTKKYDIIIVDAYQDQLYIPWTMTTEEFWKMVSERLNPNGFAAMNVNATSKEARLFVGIRNTVAKVFSNTVYAPVPEGSYNYLIVAAKNQLDFSKMSTTADVDLNQMATAIQNSLQKAEFNRNSPLLTDNNAPVEFLTDEMAAKVILE